MKRLSVAILMTLFSWMVSASAKTDWSVEVLPGSMLANFKADEFTVSGPGGTTQPSLVSTLPNLSAGVSFSQPEGFLDIKAGAGMLLNANLSALMVDGSVGYYYEVRPSILFGPHAALAYFSAPDWWGSDDIEFSGTTGFLLGIHLCAGDRISYNLSLDYLSASFDVKSVPDGLTVDQSKLDMSGIIIQFGIRAQF